MDNMERNFKVIQDLIDKAFGRFWSGDKDNNLSLGSRPPLYESIKAYSADTGKRFRMTKEQKSRGLSRDAAFAEFINQENK